MRRVIAALIVVGLTIAVILLWPSPTAEIPPDTLAGPTTTTTTAESTTTTVPDTTTTTAGEESHVVETVEEAEEILRELWFGWFEGIYLQDEERIREVVATRQMFEAATRAFGASFTQAPTTAGIVLDVEILQADHECLVVWQVIDVTAFRGPDGESESVQVLRLVDDRWRFTTSWMHRDDLWEADCETELQPLS